MAYKTPGVYIEEKDAFSTSIVAVPTAIPAFIGYTEKALRGTKLLKGTPTRIGSFAEYLSLFGGAAKTQYDIVVPGDAGAPYKIAPVQETLFYLFNSIKLFYTNGGGPCYIVSIGSYEEASAQGGGKKKDLFLEGIQALLKYPEPTMVVIPDSVLLIEEECFEVQKTMIKHCGVDMRSRIAILDVFGVDKMLEDPVNVLESDLLESFREGVGMNTLDFGAAYYPWLNTSVTSASEVSYANISDTGLAALKNLLNDEAGPDPNPGATPKTKIGNILEKIGELTDKKKASDGSDLTADDLKGVEQAIKTVSALYKDILKDIREQMNLLPPSGAIAGLYSYVDSSMSVARSPANFSLNSVVSPAVAISNEQQENLNVPLDGKAINAIRAFPGKGTLVWGARTLDGNSQDWRYISVRRAVIMIEQSIKIALGAYVFAPNVQNTWLDVQNSINNFLTSQWNNGVLAGAAPSEAFSVSVGLGSTMTPQDILDGIMRVEVKLAVVRPAEFIVVTFQQQMQTS